MRPKLLILLILIALAGIGWLVVRRVRAGASRPNIILISLDTCRADHLGCYGHPAKATPNIDAVAAESVLFRNAISPVPMTLPAHSSLLTGTIPPYHGVHDNIHYRLGESNVTLAEHLKKLGYNTAAIIGAYVLDSQTGIDQGFDVFDDEFAATDTPGNDRPERRAGDVSRLAQAWLAEQPPQPFFLLLHYFDPHFPYEPPEPFSSRFRAAPYTGEIAYTDQAVGEVISRLKDLGLYESSVVVIVGDHGESLGEHGEQQHGYFIYHSTTKVPLIVKFPGRTESRVIEKTVSLADVMPTILAAIGAPIPQEVQGTDLMPRLQDGNKQTEPQYVYSESMWPTKYDCNSLLGIETSEWKYIQTTRPELYDLRNDPAEQINVLAEHPQQTQFFQAQLASILESSVRRVGEEGQRTPDADSVARLRALGYTGGPLDDSYEFDTESQDPKDFIDAHLKIERIDMLKGAGRDLEARMVGLNLLAQRPDLVVVHSRLGSICVRLGDEQAAMAHYAQAIALAPDHADAAVWHHNIGRLFRRKNQLDKAELHLRESLRRLQEASTATEQPDAKLGVNRGSRRLILTARLQLGDVLTRKGQITEAAEVLRKAVEAAPQNAVAHYRLSQALSALGLKEEAAAEHREAMRLREAETQADSGVEPAPDKDDDTYVP